MWIHHPPPLRNSSHDTHFLKSNEVLPIPGQIIGFPTCRDASNSSTSSQSLSQSKTGIISTHDQASSGSSNTQYNHACRKSQAPDMMHILVSQLMC
jgi:hypothetical protein